MMETKYHTLLTSLLLGCYILIIHPIHMSMYALPVHIHSHINKASYYWNLMKNWWLIFIVRPASARDNNPNILPFGNYITSTVKWELYYTQYDISGNYITPNTTLQFSNPHYKYDIIPTVINFPPPPVYVEYFIINCSMYSYQYVHNKPFTRIFRSSVL